MEITNFFHGFILSQLLEQVYEAAAQVNQCGQANGAVGVECSDCNLLKGGCKVSKLFERFDQLFGPFHLQDGQPAPGDVL